MKYSLRAITCCVSKGMLILVVLTSLLVGLGLAIHLSKEARIENRERCESIAHTYRFASEEMYLERITDVDCLDVLYPEPTPEMPEWAITLIVSILASGTGILLLFSICQGQISYCQIAVDTKRKPWYWIPKIGNPLPPRELVTCVTCNHSTPETDDQYRERLGLEPLDKE